MAVQDRLKWPQYIIMQLSKLTFCNSYLRLNECPSKFSWLISYKAVIIMCILYVCKITHNFGKCWPILLGSSLSTPKFILFYHHIPWTLVVLEDISHALYIIKKYDHPVAFGTQVSQQAGLNWACCFVARERCEQSFPRCSTFMYYAGGFIIATGLQKACQSNLSLYGLGWASNCFFSLHVYHLVDIFIS